MSSSIFSSKAAPSIALGWIFLSAFLLLVGVGRIIDQRFPMWRMTTPFQSGIPSLGTKWLLSNLINVMEYDAYLHDLAGTTEYMRKAEVLFLGNSRALYGFRPEGYQPHLDRYGLRGYTLAFHGGTDLIPLELIRRYDLRPKLLIISSDGFFVDGWQRFTESNRNRSYWAGWKFYFESVAAWETASRMHRWIPAWRRYLFQRDNHVVYRSIETGGIYFPYALPNPRLLTERLPDAATPAEVATSELRFSDELKNLRSFAQEMSARGTAIILTIVPYPELESTILTRRLSEATGIPYVEVWPKDLRSYTGSHMDGESAVRFADALFEALRHNPAFMKVAGPSR